MSHPRLNEIRQRYGYRCGYCEVSEVEAGGELTVDHFHPLSAGGGDSEENLVYCCPRCNLYKSDYFPSAEDAVAGRRILHPLRDSMDQHYRCDDETGVLEPLTETGQFHILLLHLNRPALMEHRRNLRFIMMLTARAEWLENENRQLRALLETRERRIEFLDTQGGIPPPPESNEEEGPSPSP